MEYTSSCQEETIEAGKSLSTKLRGGDVVLLHGELGAGKTTFVKGLANGLGVKDIITSPTFTLMNIYKVKNSKFKIQNFVHVDTYRMKDEEELMEIGIEDYLGNEETICVIEWPEKVLGLLESVDKKVNVNFEHLGGDGRRLKIED